MKKMLIWLMMGTLLCGCSMFQPKQENNTSSGNKPNENTTQKKEDLNDKMNEAKEEAEHTISNMLDYFKEKGIEMSNVSAIEELNIPAYEGRMFEVDGANVYLYRLDMNNESMKRLMEEAQQNGTLKVNASGVDQDYRSLVNGNFLLLYEKDLVVSPLDSLFYEYAAK